MAKKKKKRAIQSAAAQTLRAAISSPLTPEQKVDRDLDELNKLIAMKNGAWGEERGNSRQRMFDLRKKTIKDLGQAGVTRNGGPTDEDPFIQNYDEDGLIAPRYSPAQMFDIVEECDTLKTCVDSMVEGVDGNGHGWQFAGNDKTERDLPENKEQAEELANFFDNVNSDGSLVSVRKSVRADLESTGNGAMEVVRNIDQSRNPLGDIEEISHLPITYCRMSVLDKKPTEYTVKLWRKGKIVSVTRSKHFRRYARKMPSGKITWFKEFGDPRTLDANTGQYVPSTPTPATELIWFKLAFRNADYGVPRWIGALTTIKGRVLANWCNFDLFNNQGIPPLLIVVEDGQLTPASIDEIEGTIESWHDVNKMNRTCILHVEPQMINFDGQRTKSAVQVIKLRDARKEDFLFENYLAYSEKAIRKVFRLPPLIQGTSEDYSLASATASQIVAEQQVFGPIRRDFDEFINVKIVRAEFGYFNWRFVSKGPKITGSEELTKMIRMFAISGGASSNQIIELANETLGTDWSIDDSAASKIPVMVLQSLTRLNRIDVTDDGKLVVLPAPVSGTTNGNQGDNGNDDGQNDDGQDDGQNDNQNGNSDGTNQVGNNDNGQLTNQVNSKKLNTKRSKNKAKGATSPAYQWLLKTMESIEDEIADRIQPEIDEGEMDTFDKSNERVA
jgi:capsid portal protein